MNTLILYLTVCTVLFIVYLVISAKVDGKIRINDVKCLFIFAYIPFINVLFILSAMFCLYSDASNGRMVDRNGEGEND